jgi:hypothetical protein
MVDVSSAKRIQAITALLALLTLVASASAGAANAGHPRLRGHTRLNAIVTAAGEASSNWAGYAITSPDPAASFTRVIGTWKQPPAKCGINDSDSATSFWVGLGGKNETSQALEQIGTSSDCNPTGPTSYYAWYEVVPAPPISFALKIVPGDTITASVTVSGKLVMLLVKNLTRHTAGSQAISVKAPDLSSAEWIVEAPSACDGSSCDMVPLADFGSTGFSKIQATRDGHTGKLGDSAWTTTPMQLITNGQQSFYGGPLEGDVTYYSKAGTCLPTRLANDGGSFTLSWVASASPTC